MAPSACSSSPLRPQCIDWDSLPEDRKRIAVDMMAGIEAVRVGVGSTEELGEDKAGQALAWVEKGGLGEWVRVVVAC